MVHSKKKSLFTSIFILLLALSVIFCIFSAALQESAFGALMLCATSVVPSLYPFMVISSILTQSAPFLFGSCSQKSKLLDLPASSLIAVILGCVCGFPLGVVTVAGLKRRGLLTSSQADRLAAVSNNTGPAFVTGVIGGTFWGSSRIGLQLYLIQLVSALILGTFFLIFTAQGTHDEPKRASPCRTVPGCNRLPVIFTEAVGQATLGILRVCGFVVFFAVLIDGVSIIFPHIPTFPLTVIACITEFTTGCSMAAAVGGATGAALCAFALGFSGVSVMAQSAAFAAEEGISLRMTFLFKLVQGLCCALLAYFII